jgi:hypothetical protein
MTANHEERSVPADVLVPLPFAAALSHLRGACAAVDRLLADTHPSDPKRYELLKEAGRAIHIARQALTDCAQASR